jgi:hypothetical protein
MSIIITKEILADNGNHFAICARVAPDWGPEGYQEKFYDPDQTHTGNHIDIAMQLIEYMDMKSGEWRRILMPDDTQMFIHQDLLSPCFDFDNDPDKGAVKAI